MSRCGSCPLYGRKMSGLYCEGNQGVDECAENLQSLFYELTGHISKLCEACDFNPTIIGSNILKAEGYEVIWYPRGDVAVRDRGGKLLCFKEAKTDDKR